MSFVIFLNSISKVAMMASRPGKKTNVSSYFFQHVYFRIPQFLRLNLLFALSYFVFHDACLFFSVRVSMNCACLFQGIFSGGEDSVYFLRYNNCFCKVQLSKTLDSQCVSCPHPSLLKHLLHYFNTSARQRECQVLSSLSKKALLVAVGRPYSTCLECTDEPVTRDHSCPAALPAIAGPSPNLA